MAAKAKAELNWVELDVTALSPVQQQANDAQRDAYAAYKAAKAAFELTLQPGVPVGFKIITTYTRWGALKAALTEVEAAKAGPKGAVDLSTLIRRG